MKKVIIRVLLIVLFLSLGYIIWDNYRIVLVEETIILENFPDQLDYLRILQISDLHEKEFGRNQKRLINKINSTEYDVIVFTGDLLNDTESENYDSFYKLIEGIDNKEHALYVRGNTDPLNYQIDQSVDKSNFIKGMEERGVKLLESIYSIPVNNNHVHFVYFDLSIISDSTYIGRLEGVERPEYVDDKHYLTYQKKLWQEISLAEIIREDDLLIAVNHYPIADNRVNHIKNNPGLVWHDFDLIIAGHYHGGQIRIPFKGALFVPEPWYEPNQLFPPQNRVKGLWKYAGVNQYVSAGLGNSGAVPLLNFRLFNPPEINLLTLSKK